MNQINVGWGPVTWQGVLATVIWALGAAAAFLTTLAGGLPQDKGIMLTALAGLLSTLSMGITAAARHFFAKVKANVMPWEEELPVEDVPAEPSDTTVPVVDPK